LVQRGTLRLGDDFIAGEAFGKVRTLTNDRGEAVSEAGPGTPVQVTGLDGVPGAGDLLLVGDDKPTLKALAVARTRIARTEASTKFQTDMMRNIGDLLASAAESGGAAKEVKEVTVLVKADVMGSAEALATALGSMVAEDDICKVKVKVLSAGVGDITKSDVAIAGVSDAWVVGFNVAANFAAMEDARVRGLTLGYYNVVYEAMEEMERRMQKVLSPVPEGVLVGKAEVKEVFEIGKVGKIAGCGVVDGNVQRGGNVRVLRGNRIVHEGKLRTLKSFKEDVQKVETGNDCGINFFDWEEMEVGDLIECYTEQK